MGATPLAQLDPVVQFAVVLFPFVHVIVAAEAASGADAATARARATSLRAILMIIPPRNSVRASGRNLIPPSAAQLWLKEQKRKTGQVANRRHGREIRDVSAGNLASAGCQPAATGESSSPRMAGSGVVAAASQKDDRDADSGQNRH